MFTDPTPAPSTPLLPYSGPRKQILTQLGTAWNVDRYDSDQTGRCAYEFNTLGYRGTEYEQSAPYKVFIFGESDAFGLGVNYEEIWAVQVARERARLAGFSAEQTCIMNFSECGASNSLIARMLVTQCNAVRPDLVLIQIAEDRRVELIDATSGLNGGPWFALKEVKKQIKKAPDLSRDERKNMLEILARGRSYLEYCTPQQGLYETLIELLLMHETASRLGVDAFAVGKELERFSSEGTSNDPRLGPLVRCMRPGFLRDVPVAETFTGDTSGVDEHHMGPVGHKTIAEHLLAKGQQR
jgi:hypothetical protein